MTDITMYLAMGAVMGAVAGGAAIYLLPYRAARRDAAQVHAELRDSLAKRNELQDLLQAERSTVYQVRQSSQQQQNQSKSDLDREQERYAELERQRADLQARHDEQQQNHLSEATKLRRTVENLEQELTDARDRFARDGAQWERERQSLVLHDSQLGDQLESLRRDKTALGERLEQQQESWEQERLALQIHINTLEDNLSLQTARADHAAEDLPPDSQQLMERLRVEAAEELDRRQTLWEEERQGLREQLERLQAESRALREQTTVEGAEIQASPLADFADRQMRELRQQVEQAQQERQHLEERLVARERQSEQERIALEAEIEQLMDRLLRLHREQSL